MATEKQTLLSLYVYIYIYKSTSFILPRNAKYYNITQFYLRLNTRRLSKCNLNYFCNIRLPCFCCFKLSQLEYIFHILRKRNISRLIFGEFIIYSQPDYHEITYVFITKYKKLREESFYMYKCTNILSDICATL